MVKAVIFDMDGVLIDSERISIRAWRRKAAELGLDRIDEVHTGCVGLNRNDGIALLKSAYGNDFDGEGFLSGAKEIMNEIIAEEGLPVKTGVREILTYLQEEKIPVALCSSTKMTGIQRNLEMTGLGGFFQKLISGDMVEHSKPEPDIYLKACDALGFAPHECMAVEDSPNGIRSASRAGLITILVPDLVPPTEEMISLCFRKEETLLGLLTYLQNEQN